MNSQMKKHRGMFRRVLSTGTYPHGIEVSHSLGPRIRSCLPSLCMNLQLVGAGRLWLYHTGTINNFISNSSPFPSQRMEDRAEVSRLPAMAWFLGNQPSLMSPPRVPLPRTNGNSYH